MESLPMLPCYEACAGEQAVLLLHGLYSSGEELLRYAGEPPAGVRLLSLTLPCHRNAPAEDRLTAPLAARLVDSTLRAQGVERLSAIIGHSMGGRVALELADLRADLQEPLFLLDAPTVPPPVSMQEAHVRLAEVLLEEGVGGLPRAELRDRAIQRGVDATLLAYALRTYTRQKGEWGWEVSLRGIAHYLRRSLGEEFTVRLAGQVHLLVASQGSYCPPNAEAALKHLSPRATLRVVQGASHLSICKEIPALLDALTGEANG